MSLVFVDCEAWGGCPRTGQLTEFGAVHYPSMETFYGCIVKSTPDPNNPAIPIPVGAPNQTHVTQTFIDFHTWLTKVCNGERPVFVSDNPAFDWQWINDGFWTTMGMNPFGHSARRIGDFAAGLARDWKAQSKWKRLRITKHDHNPVHDAIGNAEAFRALMNSIKETT